MGKSKLKVMPALRQNAKKQHQNLKSQVPINLQKQKPIRLEAIRVPILDNAVPLHHKQVDVAIDDNTKGAVTKQPLKFKKLLVDYMKSTNNFFVFLSKKGPEGPFSLV